MLQPHFRIHAPFARANDGEREEYYETTLTNAINGTNGPSFWR